MKANDSKKNILKKIKQALSQQVPVPFADEQDIQPVFAGINKDLELQFATHFFDLQGRFSFCQNAEELVNQLQTLFAAREWNKIYLSEEKIKVYLNNAGLKTSFSNDLASCNASITSCEFLVARTGSIALSSAQTNGRTASVYAPVHICIAFTNQLVYDIEDALTAFEKKYKGSLPSLLSFATGPSRTSDIEKTLVTGVHGPKEVFCFLIEAE